MNPETPQSPATPTPPVTDQPATDQTTQPKLAPKSNKSLLSLLVVLVLVATAVISAWVIYKDNSKIVTTKAPIVAGPPAKVSIEAGGFVPTELNITIGTTVIWTNTDTAPHRVASDPYPTNDGLPGFDSKEALQSNDTYTYKFEKAGTFGYHDHQNPSDSLKGTVVVTPAGQN